MILKEALNSSYLKEEAEADPLVISDISPLLWVYCLVDAGVSNINTCTVTIIIIIIIIIKASQ